MCGIVGYVGTKNASDILIDGLSKLEYRGYDSAGIAVVEKNGITALKSKGRLKNLCELIEKEGKPSGNIGIGHTRWATHGEPSDINSHPHSAGKVTLVHNGIIENYLELKEKLQANGFIFKSQTDTEVIAAFLDCAYEGNPIKAIDTVLKRLRGSYALAILFEDKPNEIYAIRKDSPLVVGLSQNENFIASDIPAVLTYTRNFYLMEENEIAIISKSDVKVINRAGEEIKKEVFTADWDIEAAEKGGYPHFMIKEIYEEPKALSDTIFPNVKDMLPCLECFEKIDVSGINNIYIVACGTAMHAGLIGKYAIEKLAKIKTEVCIASEFRYNEPLIDEKSLVIIISQSGETADSLAALRLSKQKGAKTLAIVNVVGSSIAREAENCVFTYAGPEIAVASTKAYSVQCAVMLLISFNLAFKNLKTDKKEIENLTKELCCIPQIVERTIKELDGVCEKLSHKLLNTNDLFFIGRGIDYCVCEEGSLKLKEISYIHSEAYAAGELKHGTISLITNGTPVVAIATQAHLFEKMLSNIKEVASRGAEVFAVIREDFEILNEAQNVIKISKVSELLMPLVCAPFIQLLAYHTAVNKGCDADKPRNLAKSVTVE